VVLTVSTVHGDRFDRAGRIVQSTLGDSSRRDRRASRVDDEPVVKGVVLALSVGGTGNECVSKRMNL
jgi:hypothetical protein